MVRTGFGIACAALLGTLLVGCSTDVEDPGFTGGDETSEPTTEAPPASTSSDEETTASSESATSTTGKDTAADTTTTGNDTAVEESSSGGEDPTDDSSDTAAGCGDGVVSPGEQCDGVDLQGFDCASLGLGTGALGCDPVMCTFDTQMCESDTGGTSG